MTRAVGLTLLLILAPSLIISRTLGDDAGDQHKDSDDRVLHKFSQHDRDSPDYDHEAFLGGEEEADQFENLSPEESMDRLGKIVDRIDQDQDGFVTFDEMRSWLDYTHKR